MRIALLGPVAIFLALVAADAGAQEAIPGTQVGRMHPDFALADVDGKIVRLSEFRGRKVLLFHFASW